MQMIPPRPAQTIEPAATPQAEQLTSAGWSKIERSGFLSLIGPLWHRMAEGEAEFALIAEDKHHNRRGVVQGGLLMTFADLSCGMTARLASGKSVVTVQMDTKFMDTTKIGEILQARPRVIRTTRSLVFVSAEITASGRSVGAASGVFKTVAG